MVGRARRAWLPPSATWLFKPRNATHTTGELLPEHSVGKTVAWHVEAVPHAFELAASDAVRQRLMLRSVQTMRAPILSYSVKNTGLQVFTCRRMVL